jgi:hypothetical protein
VTVSSAEDVILFAKQKRRQFITVKTQVNVILLVRSSKKFENKTLKTLSSPQAEGPLLACKELVTTEVLCQRSLTASDTIETQINFFVKNIFLRQ